MLTERDLWRAMTCAAESRKSRESGHIPGPIRWVDELIDALRTEREALAHACHPNNNDLLQSPHDDLLTAREVAEMIDRPLRTVYRHADKLGAIRPSGRVLFPRSAITEHLNGSAA